MDFQNYQAEDFLTNDSFLNYCTKKNAADIRFWENWLLNNPEKRSAIAEALTLYSQLIDELSIKKQTQQDLEGFKRVFSKHIRSPVKTEERTSARSMLYISEMTAIAAASIILVIAFIFFYGVKFYGVKEGSEKNRLVQTRIIPQNSTRKTMTLPDGSLVTLNPNSQIEVDKDFNKEFRIVKIEGEAFFEVVKDRSNPFIVKAGDISTTALGTSFMVRYYPHEDRVKISLLSGKVKVERLNSATTIKNAVYLTPGLEVVIDKRSIAAVLHKKPFKSEHLKEWKLNFLTFNDAEFNEIVSKLEEWYGVQVEVTNAPEMTKHFTGEFKDQNLSTVLEALGFAHKFQYQIKPDTVIINFKPTP
jgi:transmembrane sensor